MTWSKGNGVHHPVVAERDTPSPRPRSRSRLRQPEGAELITRVRTDTFGPGSATAATISGAQKRQIQWTERNQPGGARSGKSSRDSGSVVRAPSPRGTSMLSPSSVKPTPPMPG